eukprot:scaffold117185_cov21-Tisochrysis_lutea.AAC.1
MALTQVLCCSCAGVLGPLRAVLGHQISGPVAKRLAAAVVDAVTVRYKVGYIFGVMSCDPAMVSVRLETVAFASDCYCCQYSNGVILRLPGYGHTVTAVRRRLQAVAIF